MFKNYGEIDDNIFETDILDDEIYIDSGNIVDPGNDDQIESIKSFAMCMICFGIVKSINDGFACN